MGALYLQHLQGWQNNALTPGMPLRAGAPDLHLSLVFQPPMIDEGGTEEGEKKKEIDFDSISCVCGNYTVQLSLRAE